MINGKLTLHEAMVVILISFENRTGNTDQIAMEINKRGLYERKDKLPLPANQIRDRAFRSNGRYQELFEWLLPNQVKLKNLKAQNQVLIKAVN